MAEKRPSDRRNATMTLRLTKAERAWLRQQRTNGESVSDAARRLLFAQRSLLAHPEPPTP